MTLKEHYDKAKSWQRKCIVISFYHHGMLIRHKGKWNVRRTSQYFGVSIGKVSEDIKLCLVLDIVKHCKTRQDALLILRSNNGNK